MLPLVFSLAAAGCAQVQQATHPLGAEALRQLQADVDGKLAEVTLHAPVAVAARRPTARITGRVFLEEATVRVVQAQNQVVRRPLREVQEINTNRRVNRALGGLLAGALAGAAVGGILGAFSGHDCSGPDASYDCLSRGSAAVMMGVIAAAPGAVLGTGIGAATGGGPIWRFTASTAPAAESQPAH